MIFLIERLAIWDVQCLDEPENGAYHGIPSNGISHKGTDDWGLAWIAQANFGTQKLVAQLDSRAVSPYMLNLSKNPFVW